MNPIPPRTPMSLRSPSYVLPVVTGLLLSTASAAAPAQSADSSRTLPALVVTATREHGALRSEVATTTVLDGRALRAEGITHLADALRRVPGVAVMRQSGLGSQTSLFLRGGQANYVRLLIDGVPVNEPGGTLDLARITLDDVERIEVVRGPASVLYGTDAVTGVIQLFTRRAGRRASLDAEAGGGSFGARRGALGASGMAGAADWSLRADHHAAAGILAFNNGYRNDGIVATAGLGRGATRTDARMTARYNASQYQYPTESDGTVNDRNAERTEHRLMLGAEVGHRWNDRVETRAQASFNELHPRTSDGPDGPGDDDGYYGYFERATVARHLADLRTTWRLGEAQRLAVGAEYARDAQRGSSLTLSEFGQIPDEFRATRANVAGYAQLLGDVGRWSYTAGARIDENTAFGTFHTARLGAAFRLARGLTVRAAAGTAFKAPTFFENFAQGFTIGNRDLRPEQSRSADVGVEAVMTPTVTVRATAFATRFTDLIQYTGTPPHPGAPNFYNIAAANAGGVELELALTDVAGLSASASYTWTDTRVVDAGFSSSPNDNFVTGGRLLRRPEHAAALQVSRALGSQGTLTLGMTHVGRREDRDFSSFPAGIVFLDGYETIDVGVEHALPGRWMRDARVQLRAENLTGERYEAVYGFETPGRAIFAGLRLRR